MGVEWEGWKKIQKLTSGREDVYLAMKIIYLSYQISKVSEWVGNDSEMTLSLLEKLEQNKNLKSGRIS